MHSMRGQAAGHVGEGQECMGTGSLHHVAAHWAHLLGKWATEWPTSGPLLIPVQNNLILYLPYYFLTKALPKFEYDLLFGQPL